MLQSYTSQSRVAPVQERAQIHVMEESPEVNPHTCRQLIHGKRGKTVQRSKDSLFNKWCWENCAATCKRMGLERPLSGFKHPDACFWGFLNGDTSRALREPPGLWSLFRDVCKSDSPAAHLNASSDVCQFCLNTTGRETEKH